MNNASNNSPPLYDRFLLSQYTYHGDTIINSLLRGTDNIKTYRDNISTIYELTHLSGSNKIIIYFACLYLELIMRQPPPTPPQKVSFKNKIKSIFRKKIDTTIPTIPYENILELIMKQNDNINII